MDKLKILPKYFYSLIVKVKISFFSFLEKNRFDFLIKTPDLFFKRLEYYLQQNNNFKFIKLTQTHEIFSVDNYKMI